MRFGFAVLRLPPRHFWALTPREIAAAMGGFGTGGERLDESALTALMERFPDA